MTRRLNKVQVLFLFLAAFVFNAHMMIPHDHHSADLDTCHEKSYPFSRNTGSDHSGFPPHCHAFNDLASEKAVSYSIVKHAQVRDLIPCCILNSEVPEVQMSWIRITDYFHKPEIAGLSMFYSHRAPPSLA